MDSTPVKLRTNSVPRHLVSNDSFRSIYDNQPTSPETSLPIPPIDYNTAETSDNNRLSVQSAASAGLEIRRLSGQTSVSSTQPCDLKLSSSPMATHVSETNSAVLIDSRSSSYRQSSDSAIEEVDVVELRLDLSDEDDKEVTSTVIEPPELPARPEMPMSRRMVDTVASSSRSDRPSQHQQESDSLVFNRQLESPLRENRQNSRSVSRSPEFDLDDNSSHMYTRSAGFRSRNMSPRGARSRQSSTDTETSLNQISPDTELPPAGLRYTPPSKLPVRIGPVEIPVTHIAPNNSSLLRYPQPDDRPAFNPGFVVNYPSSPRSPTPRPFPVPRSNIPVMTLPGNVRSNMFPAEPAVTSQRTNQAGALHMVSPTRPTGIPSPPRRQIFAGAKEASQPLSPPQQQQRYGNSLGFHTFGGRGRQRQSPPVLKSPPLQERMPFANANSGLRPPRYHSTNSRLNQTLPSSNKTFYVVTDSSKQPATRGPFRYDFNEDETPQKPVFL